MSSSIPSEEKIEAKKEEVKKGLYQYARNWGTSSLPPTLLATLIAAQHLRPFQPLPMLFPPILLGCSYANQAGYVTDAAGIGAAWSGLYLLLASRRKQKFMSRFSARGIVRGASMSVAAVNLATGAVAYMFGKRSNEPRPED